MTETETLSRLETLIRRIFQAPQYAARAADRWDQVPNWDSMNYVLLIEAAQKEFAVRISAVAAGQFQTVGDLARALLRG